MDETLAILREEVDLLLEEIEGRLEQAGQEELVEAAALADHLRRRLTRVVDTGREALRRAALEAVGVQGGAVRFTGGHGRATVVVPPPKLKLAETADVPHLQGALGPQFSVFFDERTTYVVRPDAADEILAAEEPVRSLLLGSVSEAHDAPQVSFRYEP